jgi:hypothetical protein
MTEQQQAQAETEGCMGLPGPDEHHERLEPFVGTFKAVVKLWMGPGEPMVSTGVMTNTMELGGRFLHQHYQGDSNPDAPFPDFQGRGYWGYNHLLGKYEGFWIDTASTMMQNESGDVDASGKVWTMTSEMPDSRTMKPTQKKSVITLTDRDHNSMEMFFTDADGKEIKGMEIRYTRG